jgi:oligopeptide transport system substrate-binding protein
LRIGRAAYPDVIDPQRSAFGNGIEVLKLAYEGLLSIDEKGNLGPGGADKCEPSKDGTSMTCRIREDLKRADGTPITAKDYEYALERAVDPRVPGKMISYILYAVTGAEDLDAIDRAKAKREEIDKAFANYGVKATDDKTLVVTFKKPVGYWQFIASTLNTAPPDKKQIDKDPDNWWTKPEGHNGNGPFKIKSIDPGKRIVLVPNENYWRGKPKLDRIELIYYADGKALLGAYKKGDIDLVGSIAPDDLAAIDADATLKAEFLRFPAALTDALGFNKSRKPFDDKNVRVAFSQAFDRDGWVSDVLKGIGKPYTRWIPPGVPGAQPDKPGVPSYDPKAAVLTLVNNGYAAKDSTADKPKVDCAKLGEIKLTFVASPLRHTRFQFLAGNFARVFNCPITLDPVDQAAYESLSRDIKTAPQIFHRVWVQDYPHPQNWLSLYWVCEPYFTYPEYSYCNKDFDALVTKADQELDSKKSLELYQQAEDVLLKDVPAAFANYAENIYLVKPYVMGLKDHISPTDTEWPGEWGPVWTYDIDLSQVPTNYPMD